MTHSVLTLTASLAQQPPEPGSMRWLAAGLTLLPFALLAWLLPRSGNTRQGILFGVTLPLDFAVGHAAQAIVRGYRRTVRFITLLILLAAAACALSDSPLALTFGTSAGILLDLLLAFVLYQRAHRRLLPHAIRVPLVRSAELDATRSFAPLACTVAALLPLAAAALWLQAHWDSLPARWPQHWNARGVPNGWATRTAAGVYGPLLSGAALLLIFVLLVAFMTLAPGTQTRQRRRFLAPAAAMAWTMSLLFCALSLTPLLPGLGEGGTVWLVLANVTVLLSLAAWGLYRSNMSPTADPTTPATPPYDGTPDNKWRAGGLIYFNPADAAILVPKRMGFGWTLNFGRPAAWWYLAAILGLAVGASAVPLWLH